MNYFRDYLNNSNRHMYATYMALAIILLIGLVLRLNFLHVPLDRDEGWYGYLGQEVLRGAIPYRDVIEQKPPGIFYINALIVAIFGSSVEAVRLATTLYSLCSITVVYRISTYCSGVFVGLVAALLFAVYSTGPVMEGFGSNTEVFMVLPMLLSSYFFLRWLDSSDWRPVLLSGCFAAMAAIIKPVAAPFFVLILVFICFKGFRDGKIKSIFRNSTLFLLPSLLLLFIVYLYFRNNDAWDDLFYWNITFNSQYGQASMPEFMSRLLSRGITVSSEHVLLWMLSIPTTIWIVLSSREKKLLFLAALIPTVFVGVAMPGKFWAHYFIPLVAPLSIVSAIGLQTLFKKRGVLLYCSLPILSAGIYYSAVMDYPYYLRYSPEEISTNKFQNPVFVISARVAKYIKQKTVPSDYIFQWGWEPEIYFLTERRSPNRIIAHSTIAASPNPDQFLYEMVTTLLDKKPKYIIVQSGREQWPGYSELQRIVQQNYYRETTIENMSIYRIIKGAS